ncbi:hypothetical protein [Bradyrhizobium sp. ORS 375]|uniref:hypothetical protein n=1 Tax=Bradyrhizobium sp. (strain ORS 375) TaxID=566679 RepID=UPI0011120C24|nr:hypothetical protein [Bradyrhizobium sp. ORS 375]
MGDFIVSLNDGDPMLVVITFVHGTWGRGVLRPSGDAPWTTDGSSLCRLFRDRFELNVKFRRFRWSGRNSHTARMGASEKLREFLWQGLNDHPGAVHIVVAHSHGGNVTLMSLGDCSSLRERINGVVCLATPFILAQDRNIGTDGWTILKKGTVGGLLFFAVSFVLFCLEFSLLSRIENLADTRLYLWFMVYTAVVSLLVSASLLLKGRLSNHASKLRRELSPRPLERSRLLIIRSPADEASGALAAFQILGQATVRLFFFGKSIYASIEDLTKQPGKLLRIGLRSLLACVAFASLSSLIISFSESSWLIIPPAVAAAIFFVVGFAASIVAAYVGLARLWPKMFSWLPILILSYCASVLAMLTWLIIPVLSLLLMPFGWQVALANILLNVTAEAVPPGSWEIHLIEPPTSEEVGGPVPPLMHQVYQNPHVQAKVCQWIEVRAQEDQLRPCGC